MHIEIGAAATGPLRDVRVIDLSTIVSGPLCAQILGDLGADVIKIESPIGDTTRYMGGQRKGDLTGFFAQMNRNKRSVVLDLKSEQGAAALRRMVARADVVLENFRPDVMDRLGLGYETLAKENPRLIYGAINGFGSDGPYAEQPAYDMVIQALSGFSKHARRRPRNRRLDLGTSLADKTGRHDRRVRDRWPRSSNASAAEEDSGSRSECSTPSVPSSIWIDSGQRPSVRRPATRPRARCSSEPGRPQTATSRS